MIFQAELHLTRVARGCCLPEACRNHCALDDRRVRCRVVQHGRRRLQDSVHTTEVRVVEKVEDIPAELELDGIGHAEVLVEREIRLEIARARAVASFGGPDGSELESVQRVRVWIDDLLLQPAAGAARFAHAVRSLVVGVSGSGGSAVETRNRAGVGREGCPVAAFTMVASSQPPKSPRVTRDSPSRAGKK